MGQFMLGVASVLIAELVFVIIAVSGERWRW